MNGKRWQVYGLAALFVLAVLVTAGAGDKVPDGGKASKFKGKEFKLKAKGKAKIALTFSAKGTYIVTVKSTEKSDVNLYIYDEDDKVVEKDESPGPDCEIKFTPKKSGKYVLEVVNKGPGDNKSTLKVARAKKKEKAKKDE
jgi:hypothetical protein